MKKIMSKTVVRCSAKIANIDEDLQNLEKHIEKYIQNNLQKDDADRQDREDVYTDLKKLPKQAQFDILNAIYSLQRFGIDSPEDIGDSKKEQKYRQSRRKQEKHYTRSMANGKIPRKSLQPSIDYVIHPKVKPSNPHSPLSLPLYRLYEAISKSKLGRTYEHISRILYHFCNKNLEHDLVKRQVMRLKKSTYLKEYLEFRIRSSKSKE